MQRFGVFHDAGYKGLYAGLGRDEIKQLKGIAKTEDLLDRIGSTELAANYFRATQAEDKLVRERIRGERQAIDTHFEVGREVRSTIAKIGGTMPEKLPAAPSIKTVADRRKRRLKDATPLPDLPPSGGEA